MNTTVTALNFLSFLFMSMKYKSYSQERRKQSESAVVLVQASSSPEFLLAKYDGN